MPKKKRKRLGISKDYNCVLAAKQQAKKEAKNVISVDVTSQKEGDDATAIKVSRKPHSLIGDCSSLIDEVKQRVKEERNAQRRLRYQTQKDCAFGSLQLVKEPADLCMTSSESLGKGSFFLKPKYIICQDQVLASNNGIPGSATVSFEGYEEATEVEVVE